MWFKKKHKIEEGVEIAEPDMSVKEEAYSAYKILTDILAKPKATKAELTAAIENAVDHLGLIAVD